MKVEIWSDIACPFCYIGKKRFEKALEMFEHKDEVEVVFKSYILDPNAPKETHLSALQELAMSKGISVEKAKKLYEQVVNMAKEEGLEYNLDEMKATSTIDAHRLIQWAKTFGKEQALVDKLYEAYFIKGLNVADSKTLLDIVNQLDMDTNRVKEILDSDEFRNEVEFDFSETDELGVEVVPTFIFNRKKGISGAQQVDFILKMLNDSYKLMNKNKIQIDKDDSACGPDGCDI